jgi:hypothetical protein
MEKFKDIDTWDLIKELQSRGYNTELLWCRDDVQRQVDDINEGKEEGEEPLVLDDMEKDDILDSLSYNWYCERINEEIYDRVWEYVK